MISLSSLLLCACRPLTIAEPDPSERIEVRHEAPTVTFAVVGDYGLASPEEAAVAERVRGWSPDLVITLGDNNYPNGSARTIDENVGQYYHPFIAPYRGRYGAGASENRFFPSLGNHDWRTADLEPYLEYFTLPGNERYYTFTWGPVDFFALDSDPHEPDGVDADSVQAQWLKAALARSTAPWKVVYMHHPPYSSGWHGSERGMRWPMHAWGADVVMSGHDHHYERLAVDDGIFIVNGLGGNPRRYELRQPLPGSQVRFNESHGAMLAEATADHVDLQFVTADGRVVDAFSLERN